MKTRYFLLFLLLIPSFTYARQPHASEILTRQIDVDPSGTAQIIATTTYPIWINELSITSTQDASRGAKFYCGPNTLIVRLGYTQDMSTRQGSPGVKRFDPAYKCSGAVYAIHDAGASGGTASLGISAYTMATSTYDEPYEVSTTTVSTGGGSTTCTDDPTAVCYKDWLLTQVIIIASVVFLAIGVVTNPLK